MSSARLSRDREAARLRLKFRPLQTIEAIKDSSVVDSQAVLDHLTSMHTSPTSSELAGSLCRAICSHFVGVGPGDGSRGDAKLVRLTCIQCISQMLALSMRHLLLSIVSSAWPGIFEFMRTVYERSTTDENDRGHLESVFSGFFFSFPQYLEASGARVRRTSVLRFIIKLWHTEMGGERTASAIRTNVSTCQTLLNEQWMQAFLDVIPDYNSALTLAMDRLRSALNAPAPSPFGVFAALQPLHAMCGPDEDHCLRAGLIQGRVIPLLVRTMKAVAKFGFDREDANPVYGGIVSCLDILKILLDAKYNADPVKEALRCDLVYALMCVNDLFDGISIIGGMYLPDLPLHLLSWFLDHLFPRFFVVESFVAIALTVGDKVSLRRLNRAIRTGPLHEKWASFFDMLMERVVCQRLLSFKMKFGLLNCSNPTCRACLPSCQLKKCAGCQSVFYCSESCQRAHWKALPPHGHRDICKDPEQAIASSREMLYLATLGTRDVERHLPGLRKWARNKYPGESFENLGFHLDYTQFPVILDVIKLSGIGNSLDPALRDDDENNIYAGALQRTCGDQDSSIRMLVSRDTGHTSRTVFKGQLARPRVCKRPGCSDGCDSRVAGKDPEGRALDTICDEIDTVIKHFQRLMASGTPSDSVWGKTFKDVLDGIISEYVQPLV